MRTKNVQATLDLDDVLHIPARIVKRWDQYLQDGDILVSSANSWNIVGKGCWVEGVPDATFGSFISALRATDDRVHPRYLYWWYVSPRVQAQVRNCARQTTNISNLSFDQCLKIDIPLPPLPEQQRIAAILDKADELRAKRRAALATLDTIVGFIDQIQHCWVCGDIHPPIT